ncbi:hypothetical protein AC578_4347 [Pseudocercospora eumusae]|uniref:Uncharacterized protein n=1 Tax=Pseudocercospora eumusae TaxID=321146 RepID=A0A139H5N9_9PEZI|nr:hypothetical protein AC578_4347 [Pseudocercospora eumusae]
MASPSHELISALLSHLKNTLKWENRLCTSLPSRLKKTNCTKKVPMNTDTQMKYFLAQIVECYPHRMPDAVDRLVSLCEQTRCTHHSTVNGHEDVRTRVCLSIFPVWIEIYYFLVKSDAEALKQINSADFFVPGVSAKPQPQTPFLTQAKEVCAAVAYLGSCSYAELGMLISSNEPETGLGQVQNTEAINDNSGAMDSNASSASTSTSDAEPNAGSASTSVSDANSNAGSASTSISTNAMSDGGQVATNLDSSFDGFQPDFRSDTNVLANANESNTTSGIPDGGGQTASASASSLPTSLEMTFEDWLNSDINPFLDNSQDFFPGDSDLSTLNNGDWLFSTSSSSSDPSETISASENTSITTTTTSTPDRGGNLTASTLTPASRVGDMPGPSNFATFPAPTTPPSPTPKHVGKKRAGASEELSPCNKRQRV